jgi:hypothetical protein
VILPIDPPHGFTTDMLKRNAFQKVDPSSKIEQVWDFSQPIAHS